MKVSASRMKERSERAALQGFQLPVPHEGEEGKEGQASEYDQWTETQDRRNRC
jgi:hypothetical protein